MNSTIKNIFNNPIYYLSKFIHPLKNCLPVYVKKNGIYSEFEKLYTKKIVKFIHKNDVINIMCVDNLKLYDYLKSKGFQHVRIVDLNPNHILEKRADYEFYLMSNIQDIPNGDVLICFNLLNGLSDEEKSHWLTITSEKFKKTVYIGESVETERFALGPESIGTHGCRQYRTQNLENLFIKNNIHYTNCYKMDSKFYFYLLNNEC